LGQILARCTQSLRIDGTTKVSERERVVKVHIHAFTFLLLCCTMDSTISVVLLTYYAFVSPDVFKSVWINLFHVQADQVG
jgi:hypothetical protein